MEASDVEVTGICSKVAVMCFTEPYPCTSSSRMNLIVCSIKRDDVTPCGHVRT